MKRFMGWIVISIAGLGAATPAQSADDQHLGVIIPNQSADIAAEVAGRVGEIHVALGDTVAADRILVEIENPGLAQEVAQAEASVLGTRSAAMQIEIELEELDRQLERRSQTTDLFSPEELEALETQRRIKQSELDQASAITDEREASLAALRERQQALRIRAPFDGIVALQYKTTGSYVQPGERLLRLIGREPPFVRFAVPAEQAHWLAPGARVEVRAEGVDAVVWPARVSRVSPELDPGIEMVFAEASFDLDRRPSLASGAVVRVRPVGNAPRSE